MDAHENNTRDPHRLTLRFLGLNIESSGNGVWVAGAVIIVIAIGICATPPLVSVIATRLAS